MFRKSRQVLRNAWRRLVEALRVRFLGIDVFEVRCAIGAQAQGIQVAPAATIHALPLVPPEPQIGSAGFAAVLREVEAAIEADVAVSEGNSAIEAEVVDLPSPALEAEVRGADARLGEARLREADPSLGPARSRGVELPETTARVLRGPDAPSTRVRERLSAAASLPVRRRSLSFFRLPAESRVGYWHELVSQVGKQARELELIGIFPTVPMAGVRRMGLKPEAGRLNLWLDRAARGAQVGTMIVARERASGRLLRVFDRRPDGRAS